MVTDYVAHGQLVVYPRNAEKDPPRDSPLANDGRGLERMELPNEILSHALERLSPGRYLIRIYS